MSNYSESSSSQEDTISTAVAIDKDKNSQFAVKWAIDKLRLKDKRLILVHVRNQNSFDSKDVPKEGREPTPAETQQLFLPFRSFCARKGIRAKEVILQDPDVARALAEYISMNSITTIVLGASNRGALFRAFKNADVPTCMGKYAPDSCSVYVISKAKVMKLKSTSQPDTPSSSTGSTMHSAFSPVDTSNHSTTYALDSWKSTASEVSFTDGVNQQTRSSDGSKNTIPLYSSGNNNRDYQHTPHIDRSFGSKSPSPQNSAYGDEFHQTMSGERFNNSKYFTPTDSANTSYVSVGNFRSPLTSGPGENSFGHMTQQHRHADNRVSSMLQQSMNNINLEVRTKGSPHYSVSISESSEISDVMSFLSDVSFEMDSHRISDSSRSSTSSLTAEIEDELRRLKQELQQATMKYNLANQEAVTAKDKVKGLTQFKEDGESKLGEARYAHEAALAIVEREKLMCKAAVEVAHKAQRIAELETKKRKTAEMRFKQESEEKQKAIEALARSEIRYRRYTTEEIEIATNYFLAENKVGEGGYGPVFKATLDHTPVAIKVLRPDIAEGEKQFQNEVEVLSLMRHPHMVVLLGACPEYGSLVYEYMENGSLEDRLYCKDGTPPLQWPARFRIAAEIATALNFLHRTRPEPLVHRDLKPANILLDKNYVSKISDVGLCRLVPPAMADNITQYHMTAAAGTFCYIDPEYQQTGMLGTKSDVYSFGVMLLQILTGRPPMGLSHQVEMAIETGRFGEVLDQTVTDWPVEDALSLAKLALKCCELRRRDRPDLDSVILTELERLRDLGSQTANEGNSYYRQPQSGSSTSSQVHLDLNYYTNSSSSQGTWEGNSEKLDGQGKNASGSGNSTCTTVESMD